MAEEILLSVIIPAYNVERYIKDCLDSVLTSVKESDISQIEIVVIDDGSRDNTAAILENYASPFRLTKIINEKNEGISNARNKGIRAASGKYVMFVDSDDYLVADALGKVLDFLRGNDEADMVEFSHYELPEGADTLIDRTDLRNVTSGDGQFICSEWISGDCFYALVWNRIVLRSILTDNDVYFYPNLSCEDEEWVPRIFAYAKHVEFLPYNVYVYRKRAGSITLTGTGTRRNYLDRAAICDSLVAFSNRPGFSPEYSNALKRQASNMFWTLFDAIETDDGYDEDAIEKLKERMYLIPYSKNFKRRWFYRFMLWLLGVKLFHSLRSRGKGMR